MHQIAVPNGTIGVFAQGRGEPVLFVHGFPLGHDMWSSQTAAFAKNYRVIAPDLRGFGESKLTGATAATTLTMVAFAEDLHVLLHAVFVDRPVVLCGLSMGGYIAWQFFQKYRDQIKAPVFSATRRRRPTRPRRPPDAKSSRKRCSRSARTPRSTSCCRALCLLRRRSADRASSRTCGR